MQVTVASKAGLTLSPSSSALAIKRGSSGTLTLITTDTTA